MRVPITTIDLRIFCLPRRKPHTHRQSVRPRAPGRRSCASRVCVCLSRTISLGSGETWSVGGGEGQGHGSLIICFSSGVEPVPSRLPPKSRWHLKCLHVSSIGNTEMKELTYHMCSSFRLPFCFRIFLPWKIFFPACLLTSQKAIWGGF